MTWQRKCAARIADGIADWPPELCRLVAEFSDADIRWSDIVPLRNVDVSADGLEARLPQTSASISRWLNGKPVICVKGERSLDRTCNCWTLQLTTNGSQSYHAFIGVVRHRYESFYRITPMMTIDVNEVRLDYLPRYIPTYDRNYRSIVSSPDDVRFDCSADMDNGRVSVRVRSINDDTPAFDWYSFDMKPADLADSVPVVFWLCHDVVVRLHASNDRLF